MPDALDLASKLKLALRQLPSGVALVTSRDPTTGTATGMAASSVTSVSMEPPAMLVAINRAATSHRTIKSSGRFCINMLSLEYRGLVPLFSSAEKRGERFSHSGWRERHGLDYLEGVTSVFCHVSASLISGTHEIFVGNVIDVLSAEGFRPLGWMSGGFHHLSPVVEPSARS